MKIAFVFGPLSSDEPGALEDNILRADAVARELVRKGYGVLVPHNNTGYWYNFGVADETFFRHMYLELLSRAADILVASQPKEKCLASAGSIGEYHRAEVLRKPVYWSVEDVPELT